MTAEDRPLTRSEREQQRRRVEILDAATELFTTRGYANTTMQAIAEAAEFSVGYLYRHFEGKYELLRAIAERQIEIYRGIRQDVRRDSGCSRLEAMRRELQRICEHLARHPGLLAVFRTSGGCELELKREVSRSFRREDEQHFREAIERGEIAAGDPAVLAAAIDGIVWGLVRLFHENGQPDRYLEIPAIVDQLFFAPLQSAAPQEATQTRKNP